jgi:mannosyltransferase OCH1-like enzyme
MGMREWMDPDYRKELKMPISTRSDLIRLLLLSKYGGIWLDADSIPLRDMTPLIRAGPVAPSYGGTIK